MQNTEFDKIYDKSNSLYFDDRLKTIVKQNMQILLLLTDIRDVLQLTTKQEGDNG